MRYTTYRIAYGTFVSFQTGNWNNYSTWRILGSDGVLYKTKRYPKRGNDVYIEAAHTVTCTQNETCKTLNLNATQDVVRINTGAFKLSIWGTLKSYDGTYASNSFNASNAGIAGWVAGTLSFTGTASRTILGPGTTFSSNSKSAGWIMEINFPVGTIATVDTSAIRCGNLNVLSGTLDTLTHNLAANEIRIAGSDYTAQPGDGVNAGILHIYNNAEYILNGRAIKNTPTSAANGLANCIIDAGGSFRPTLAAAILPTQAYTFNGIIKYIELYAQNWFSKSTNTDAISTPNYTTVWIGGSGAKTLTQNAVISTLLRMIESAATLALSTFSLNYGTNGDLQISATRTKGSELPASSSGVNIPRNLILDAGVVYTLGVGTFNIRGTVTLGAGASVVGTLNQNQP